MFRTMLRIAMAGGLAVAVAAIAGPTVARTSQDGQTRAWIVLIPDRVDAGRLFEMSSNRAPAIFELAPGVAHLDVGPELVSESRTQISHSFPSADDAEYDVAGVVCNDGRSATPTTVNEFNHRISWGLDPNEDITCVYRLADQRTSASVVVIPDRPDETATFSMEHIAGERPATVLRPFVPHRSYEPQALPTTRWILPSTFALSDPGADFRLDEIRCNDTDSRTPSSGDTATGRITWGLDRAEDVVCELMVTRTHDHVEAIIGISVVADPGVTNEFELTLGDAFSVDAPGNAEALADSLVGALRPGSFDEVSGVVRLPPGASRTISGSFRSSVRREGSAQAGPDIGQADALIVPAGEFFPIVLSDPGPGMTLTSIDCVDGPGSSVSSFGDVNSGTARYHLDHNERVDCTFHISDTRASATLAVDTGTVLDTRVFQIDPFNGLLPWFSPLEIGANGSVEVLAPVGLDAPLPVIGGTLMGPLAEFEVVTTSCDDADSATPSITNDAARAVAFRVDPAEHVTCTFHVDPTHYATAGTVGVRIDVDPEIARLFDVQFGDAFVPNPPSSAEAFADFVLGILAPASLDPDSRLLEVRPNETTFVDGQFMTPLPAIGTRRDLGKGSGPIVRTLEEFLPVTLVDPGAGYGLDQISCDDEGQGISSYGDEAAATAHYGIDSGESVTCTFHLSDTRSSASLAIDAGPISPFDSRVFQIDPFNGLLEWFPPLEIRPGGSSVVYPPTPLGAPLDVIGGRLIGPISEFEQVTIGCDDGASTTPSTWSDSGRAVTFRLDPAEHVTCTFHIVPTHYGKRARIGVRVEPGAAALGDASFELSVGSAFLADPPPLFSFGPGQPGDFDPGSGSLSLPPNTTRYLDGSFLVPVSTLTPTPDSIINGVEVDAVRSLEEFLPISLLDSDPDVALFDIVCDDATSEIPSFGDLPSATARYGIDGSDGTVTCIFRVGDGPEAGLGADETEDPGADGPSTVDDRLVPRRGRWRTVETSSTVKCPFPIKARKSGPQTGRLTVRNDGQTLIGSGFASGKAKLTLKRDNKKDGRYVGSARVKEAGANGRLNTVWQVRSPEQMTSTNTLKLNVQGRSCTITRTFAAEFVGN